MKKVYSLQFTVYKQSQDLNLECLKTKNYKLKTASVGGQL